MCWGLPFILAILDKFGASVLIYLLFWLFVLMEEESKKKQYRIDLKEEWCQGCAICVEFCPKGVLAMDGSKVKVVNIEACTGCTLCELMCPDFAITVVKNSGK